MISAPVFWGVACGAIYFLAMWWIHSRRLERQAESTRMLYLLSEQIVAAHTPSGIEERLKEAMPRLLKASSVEMDLGPGRSQPDSLALPLVSHEQTLGVIKIHRENGEFSDDERSAAQHIANIVAAALQLQKHQAPREKSAVPQAPAPTHGSLTLMLIDPDSASRQTLLQMLSARGHRVLPATPEEAEVLSRRMKFDLVLRVGNEAKEAVVGEIRLQRRVSEEELDIILSEASLST